MKRNKFRARPTNGFASRLESRVNDELCAALEDGETLLKQVRITFACGAYHLCDFAIERDGKIVRYVEAKGRALSVWKLKMRLLKLEHPDIYSIYHVHWGDRMAWIGEKAKRKKRKKVACP
jgi:hypothetical protein